jgi:hypothetical protein
MRNGFRSGIPEHAVHGFRTKATTDCGALAKLDGMHRNGWSAWPGTGGRHATESLVGMARIMQRARGFLENDHSKPQGEQEVLGR